MHAPAGDKPNFLCVYCGKSFDSYSGESKRGWDLILMIHEFYKMACDIGIGKK